MSVKTKISTLVAVALLGIVVLIVAGSVSMFRLSQNANTLVEDDFMPLIDKDVKRLVDNLDVSIQLIMDADSAMHRAVIAEKMVLVSTDDDSAAAADQDSLDNIERAKDDLAKAEKLMDPDVKKYYTSEVLVRLNEWEEMNRGVFDKARDPDTLKFARKSSYGGKAERAFVAAREAMDTLIAKQKALIATEMQGVAKKRTRVVASAGSMKSFSSRMLTLFAGIGIGTCFLVIVMAVKSIRSTVRQLDDAIVQVSQGVDQIQSAGDQITVASQEVATGASEQASALEEISSSLEELTGMAKQNADNANQASVLTQEANMSAAQGNEAMASMDAAIQDIKKSADDTSKIVKTIDEIAFQTNLLALNAAVEAARAGDAGRGFAVVAEEVRNLALRSAESAKNTAELIEGSVRNSDKGVKIAGQVAKALSEITGSSAKVKDLVAEIAAASMEQSQGIEQVNIALSQMDMVTQKNAANSEESSSAAQELSGQANQLSDVVAQFAQISGSRTLSRIKQKNTPPARGRQNAGGADKSTRRQAGAMAMAVHQDRGQQDQFQPLDHMDSISDSEPFEEF